jgi:TctA family transporter
LVIARLGTVVGTTVSCILVTSFAATLTYIAASNAATDDAWLLLNAFAIVNTSDLWWNQFHCNKCEDAIYTTGL